jgi:hypothetical protein
MRSRAQLASSSASRSAAVSASGYCAITPPIPARRRPCASRASRIVDPNRRLPRSSGTADCPHESSGAAPMDHASGSVPSAQARHRQRVASAPLTADRSEHPRAKEEAHEDLGSRHLPGVKRLLAPSPPGSTAMQVRTSCRSETHVLRLGEARRRTARDLCSLTRAESTRTHMSAADPRKHVGAASDPRRGVV